MRIHFTETTKISAATSTRSLWNLFYFSSTGNNCSFTSLIMEPFCIDWKFSWAWNQRASCLMLPGNRFESHNVIHLLFVVGKANRIDSIWRHEHFTRSFLVILWFLWFLELEDVRRQLSQVIKVVKSTNVDDEVERLTRLHSPLVMVKQKQQSQLNLEAKTQFTSFVRVFLITSSNFCFAVSFAF